MPHNPDGSYTGAQCMAGVLDLYQSAGDLRRQLLAIIAAEKARSLP